jgi:hypothetical protein
LLTTLVRFDEMMKKKPPFSSTTLMNMFEGGCGTFGEGKRKTQYHQ